VPKAAVSARFLARESPAELQVARSEGNVLYDSDGRRYIDFVMGWCVGNFGWGAAAATRAVERYRGPDYVYPGYTYAPWHELAALLVALAPRGLTKAYRATGGSEAVDLALQAAMVHTGRRRFLSIEESYHGNTIGALSVAASGNRERCRNLLPGCDKVKAPLDAKKLGAVEQRLKRRETAAVIMEPVSINMGVMIPEAAFMSGLQRLCRRYGTLLVMDEVASGFGRTGKLFACEHYEVKPDIMCIAKAVTAGVMPMGAMLSTDAVAKSMQDGNAYSTYGWHPRSVAAAIATLRYVERHRERLLENVIKTSAYFEERLRAMRIGARAEVRVRGLAIGLDFEKPDDASDLQKRCRKAGLLVTAEDSVVLLLPALTIDRATAAVGLDILERCVRRRAGA
jgi:acetylornithine/succinyldiaminopimelate/putrescine aminotransferase